MAITTKRFFCIDGHTGGCPIRLVTGGAPALTGNNMLEKRQHFMESYDWIRTGLMFEPRGHDMMSGSMLYPPHDPANDVAILYIETSGCLAMCGHGTIGTVTMAIEEGLVQPKTPGHLRLETPAGLVIAHYKKEGNKVKSVKLINVPSFLHSEGLEIESDMLGKITMDVSYGGNFYGIIDPQPNFPGISQFKAADLIRIGCELRTKMNEHYPFVHPEDERINGLSHIQFTDVPQSETSDGRNAVLVGNNALDRSPCGTGTSARLAQLFSKGLLKEGETYINESYIGSQFIGTIESVTEVGGKTAIIPSIEGWACITGYNTILIDPEEDPYALGFQVI